MMQEDLINKDTLHRDKKLSKHTNNLSGSQ